MDQSVGNSVSNSVSPRTSKLAITSFVMGLISLVICVLWPVLALPAIICGIIALVKISGSGGKLKGKGFAIAGIVPPAVMAFLIPFLAMFLAIMMPAMNKAKNIAQRVVCGRNIEGLGASLTVYANDYDWQLPPADQWCDLLVAETAVSPKTLLCPDSDAVEGESSYAININVVGKKLDELPADMVLLFETDAGKEDGPRTEIIGTRESHSVYPKRWNQVGGPEIMRTEHEQNCQPGCNIVFADGHMAFFCGDELQSLRWTAEEKKP
jgi:prepilin-type processing-associated H-X9-DG protein